MVRAFDLRDLLRIHLTNKHSNKYDKDKVRAKKLPLTILVRSEEDIEFLKEVALLLNTSKCNQRYFSTLLENLGIVLEGYLEPLKELLRIVKNLNLALRKGITVRVRNAVYEVYFPFRERMVILLMPSLSLFEVDEIFFEEVYYDNIVQGGIIVDIGAYIGDSSVYFALKGAKRVIAFEPLRHYFKFLNINVKLNNVNGTVIAYNNAILDYEGMTFMSDYGPSSKVHPRGNIRVVCRDIANVLLEIWEKQGQIDLLKIDYEGCEVKLLKRMIIRNTVRPYKIVVETHGTFDRVKFLLEKMGYKTKVGKRSYIIWGLMRD